MTRLPTKIPLEKYIESFFSFITHKKPYTQELMQGFVDRAKVRFQNKSYESFDIFSEEFLDFVWEFEKEKFVLNVDYDNAPMIWERRA